MGSKAWCFTCNNYKFSDIEAVLGCGWSYLVAGDEMGTSGTPHIQGYMEFKSVKLFKTLQKQLGPRFHLEQRKGTSKQASEYCKKENNYHEMGKMKKQGFRGTELDGVRSMVRSGGLRQVTASCNLQQIGVAKAYLTYNEEPRDWKPHVSWFWGETDTGKSRHARTLFEGTDFWSKNKGTKWWCGYDAHENVILDDFRDTWMDFTDLLSLLDRYECTVECKGGSRQFRARKIIITCADHPKDTYKCSQEKKEQLLRRIDVIQEFKKVASEVVASEVGGVILDPPTDNVEIYDL